MWNQSAYSRYYLSDKKRKALSLFLLIFFLPHVNAQPDANTDSLFTAISEEKSDTNKILKLLTIAWDLAFSDPGYSLRFCRQASHLSDSLGFLSGKTRSLYYQSYIYQTKGDLDSAIHFINMYINIGETQKDSLLQANGYLQYGNLIRRKGETDSARHCYFRCIAIYKGLRDTAGLISAYNSLGITFKNTSDFDSSASYYVRVLKLCEMTGHERGTGLVLINLGSVYIELEDYEKAKEYTTRSIDYNLKFNDIKNVALAYTNLGIIAFEEHDPFLALDYYHKALDLNGQIGNIIGLNNLYINIGKIYKSQGSYYKALDNYNMAIEAFRGNDYKTGLISALMNAAEVYVKLGRYEKAFSLYDSCLAITFETGEKEKRKLAYESMYRAYAEAGNYAKAYEYLEKYMLLRDSIYNLEKEELIANLMFKYDKEKDQATILRQQLVLKEKSNQYTRSLFIGIGSMGLMIFLIALFIQRSRKDRIIARQKIRQLEEEKKLLAARSIVEGQEVERKRIAEELHDGLGVLLSSAKIQFSTLRDKTPENKTLIDRAARLLEQATSDVRRISHNMMPGLLTRYGFFEAVEDLFEQIDESENLSVKLKIKGETTRLENNTEIMLYRVLQEMANNTLKHAEAENIFLLMEILQDRIIFEYSDDGKGFRFEESSGNESLGLTSIRSRIKYLNGEMHVKSAPGEGVKYSFEIPINKQ